MSAWKCLFVAGCIVVAGCSTPPAPQTHSLQQARSPHQSEAALPCPFWVGEVADLRSEEQRRSWHGRMRIEVDDVVHGVRQSLLDAGVGESGVPAYRFDVEVTNAYASTVAGARTFNLVLRVKHDNGDTWIARGTAGHTPWTLSEGSVGRTLSAALRDATQRMVSGLSGRCGSMAAGAARQPMPPG